MKDLEKNSTSLVHSANELKKLIIDHPDLPLIVMAGDSANTGDYGYECCASVYAYIGEVLDCAQQINDVKLYTDRDDFEEDLRDSLFDFDGSDKEFDIFIEKELEEYDQFWKDCIILKIDN